MIKDFDNPYFLANYGKFFLLNWCCEKLYDNLTNRQITGQTFLFEGKKLKMRTYFKNNIA